MIQDDSVGIELAVEQGEGQDFCAMSRWRSRFGLGCTVSALNGFLVKIVAPALPAFLVKWNIFVCVWVGSSFRPGHF